MAKIEHPIDIIKHSDVEVYLFGTWVKARYMHWNPITESDPRQPAKGGKYRIVYSVIPYHLTTGKLVKNRLEDVHATRVRPIKQEY